MRDQAARLVAQLCARFSDAYYNMQPRISRTLLKALLDKSKPLTTHYGACPPVWGSRDSKGFGGYNAKTWRCRRT